MGEERETVTLCELVASIVLGGGRIDEWPDLLEDMVDEIDAMIWGKA
jgi:CheY-specific phosphatase CheX